MNFGRPNAMGEAQKRLDELASREAKITTRLAKARADLAEIDATALDVDDDQAVVKAGRRRREAADVVSALEAQLETVKGAQKTAVDVVASAQREADVANVERLREEALTLDAKIGARLREVLVAAVPDAARLRAVVATATRAREALEPAARGRPVRANFAEADSIVAIARVVAGLAEQGALR
jgi:hypothetical protein